MNKELLEKLSIITEEEKMILNGNKSIDPSIYTEKEEFIIDSKKLLLKGKLVQIRPHTRFIYFPKHKHNYIEVIYMCNGTTTHILDGERIVLEQGDLLFLSQNVTQEIYPAKKEDIAVNFIILPEFFDTAFKMINNEENLFKDFLLNCLSNSFKSNYLHFHIKDILPIENLIENMIWTILNDVPYKRSINQTTMGLLLMHLLNHMDKMVSVNDKKSQDFIVKVLKYIDENYKTATLSELSNILNCNISWLSKEIKKKTNKTFKEILMTKRFNQASYLLKNTMLPIESIIQIVGYDNSSYFFRKFKELNNLTPNEYRVKTYV